ncbi:acyl carrier protein [Xenorhabdus sp. XENO-7]|uniref:Acyl carrier protein n=1 Tax=Xenorhabdus aichiensis TaxID=3025874 RepID=A0ABT5M2W4_9GAMM|nr:acyl carrier protein [Xenorhabdus aichiensis]MDC9622014.1 acyl carrier protein [Xenorhabdus aichiensis]
MENNIQAKILTIWEEVIGSSNVEPSDLFLAQGANSLHLIKLASLVSKELNIHVSSVDVFTAGSVQKLADQLANKQGR